jgi:hypothetical protein
LRLKRRAGLTSNARGSSVIVELSIIPVDKVAVFTSVAYSNFSAKNFHV